MTPHATDGRRQPADSLRRALDVIVQFDADAPERSMNFTRLLNDACTLMTRQWQKTQGWESMLVPEISRRLGGGSEPADDPRARALAGSAIACLDAAIDAWTAGDGTIPLPVLLDRAMGALTELSD